MASLALYAALLRATGFEDAIYFRPHERYAGWLKNWQRHGAVYNIQGPHADALKPAGEWNQMVIECRGRDIDIWVNGDHVNHGSDCTSSASS